MWAPPETPEAIMQILRDAFDKAVNSDEFKAALATAEIEWNPDTWKRALQAADESLPQIEQFKDILQGNSGS
jgi:tripartite-type tricarboxylate transporter receptor subunit TctC